MGVLKTCGIDLEISCDVVNCSNRFYDPSEGNDLIKAATRNGWTVDNSCGVETHLCPLHSVPESEMPNGDR